MEEDGELPKTLVKLRRTPSDTPRPASTPPVIAASAIQDEDDEEKIIAELEVRLVNLSEILNFSFLICVAHISVITCLCHTLSYNNHGSKIFQRTPVKDCNNRYCTLPKAAPACTFGSLGRKVNFPQSSSSATPVDCASTSADSPYWHLFLFPFLL